MAVAQGGAHIADVEHPDSALGTPYHLNIKAVRDALDAAAFSDLPISTKIGEEPQVGSSAGEAALELTVTVCSSNVWPRLASRLGCRWI